MSKATRSDDADAFIPDPEDGPAIAGDDLAEALAEEFVEGATSGAARPRSRTTRPRMRSSAVRS